MQRLLGKSEASGGITALPLNAALQGHNSKWLQRPCAAIGKIGHVTCSAWCVCFGRYEKHG